MYTETRNEKMKKKNTVFSLTRHTIFRIQLIDSSLGSIMVHTLAHFIKLLIFLFFRFIFSTKLTSFRRFDLFLSDIFKLIFNLALVQSWSRQRVAKKKSVLSKNVVLVNICCYFFIFLVRQLSSSMCAPKNGIQTSHRN